MLSTSSHSSFFERTTVRAGLLILVVVSAFTFHLSNPFDLSIDGIQYVAFTKNLVEGHGPSRCNVSPFNLSEATYTPIIAYPPGYLLILAPLGAMGMDLFVANSLLDAVGYLLYFFLVWTMMPMLGLGKRAQALFALLSLFVMVPIHYGNSSDLWSLVFFQGALLLTLRIVKEKDTRLWPFILLGILLLAACSIRFAYYPLVFVIPAVMAFLGRQAGDRKLFLRSVLTGAMLVAGIAALSVYNKVENGGVAYTNKGFAIPDDQAAYPANLKKFDAFAHKAFFDFERLFTEYAFAPSEFGIFKPVKNMLDALPGLWRALGLLATFLVLAYLAFRYLLQEKVYRPGKANPEQRAFHLINLLTGAAVVGMLVFLSLRDPHQKWGAWTYVEETRYYAPVMIYLLLCALLWFQSGTARWARGALMGLFGLSMLYSFAFWSLGLYRTWHIEPVITPAKIKIYEEVKRVAAGTTSPVLYSGPSISEMYFVSIAGARPVMSLKSDGIYMQNHYHALLNAKILITGSPVLLLIDVRDKMEKREQFLQIYQPEKLIEYPGGALYQVRVKD